MGQVLYKHGSMKLMVYDHLTDEFGQQIAKTVLGREGRLRYQHTRGLSKAGQLSNTFFIQLQWKTRVLGVIAFSVQPVRIDEANKKILYVRYFSVSGLMRSRQGQSHDKTQDKNSIIKSWVISLFDNPGSLPGMTDEIVGLYAYVEEDNLPSLKNVKMTGFEQVGRFVTLIYSRISPKSRLNVELVSPVQYPEIFGLLDTYYKGYQLVPDWDGLLGHPSRSYAVYRIEGKVVAGVCYAMGQWKILSIPGVTGWLSRHVLGKLPFFKRLFFRDHFDFVEMEMAYIRDGYEWAFPLLVETILHRSQLHHALIWTDPDSRLHSQLHKGGQFGILQRLNRPARAGVYYKPIRTDMAFSGPCYISSDGIS